MMRVTKAFLDIIFSIRGLCFGIFALSVAFAISDISVKTSKAKTEIASLDNQTPPSSDDSSDSSNSTNKEENEDEEDDENDNKIEPLKTAFLTRILVKPFYLIYHDRNSTDPFKDLISPPPKF